MHLKKNRSIQVCQAVAVVALFAGSGAPTGAQTLTVLYNFGSNAGDPTYPTNPGYMALASDGSMWTTSQQGGQYGRGAIFKMTADGKLTVVHSFNVTDGNGPQSGLTLGSDGNFYGTAYSGGKVGVGTLFKVSQSGVFTHLADFNNTNGSYPIAPPVQGKDGNLYGVATAFIYRLTTAGACTPIFQYTAANSVTVGNLPMSLVPASDGSFYGTTARGGSKGFGTVFRVSTSGAVTVLHMFDNTNGATSYSIMQASDGNLYGTCYQGGQYNYGLVYKMAPTGAYNVLHVFTGPEGALPVSGVIEAKDGYLYGTTKGGGAGGRGAIYRIKKDGSNFELVYSLNGDMLEGRYLMQPGLQAATGKFYNCVMQGGTKVAGTFYSLDITTFNVAPQTGMVGETVTLTGLGFTGASAVTFNGKAAQFKVVSDTSITCTVPAGATAGTITVTTPNGTMTSKIMFQVVT